MAKHNETTNDTIGTLYAVTYKYVHKNGMLRTGTVCVHANANDEAKTKAEAKLKENGLSNFRLINASIF